MNPEPKGKGGLCLDGTRWFFVVCGGYKSTRQDMKKFLFFFFMKKLSNDKRSVGVRFLWPNHPILILMVNPTQNYLIRRACAQPWRGGVFWSSEREWSGVEDSQARTQSADHSRAEISTRVFAYLSIHRSILAVFYIVGRASHVAHMSIPAVL
ncbi:hypothetical protein SETIT_4G037700v2 [Setaria italica]|uniref:Uncharacterized protein n=1 Tax=Setaria italica TaxID=4555 RepID=A0A368QQG3_SETIT|nr:hypothetical protein SETIT_4G037700v2 [Setaria italica]